MTDYANCIFIAADTMRSRAYAQALHKANIRVKAGLIISSEKHQWGQAKTAASSSSLALEGLFVPDLTLPLHKTMSSVCSTVTQITTGTINCPEVIDFITRNSEEVCIFSGFGGEIVKDAVLAAGTDLLHIHSGWLPDYRGSTTVYYSILNGDGIGVSAIFLRASIDTGPILAKKRYPLPPSSTDVDYLYDSAIRADLLIQTLQQWKESGNFKIEDQNSEEGVTYYICHPVLKHMAIARLTAISHKNCQP